MIEEPCWYCRSWQAAEWDHAPVPKRHGGTAVVPACTTCHTRKDRTNLADWPPGPVMLATEAIIHLSGTPDLRSTSESVWDILGDDAVSPEVRLAGAKMFALWLDMEDEKRD